MDKKSELEWIYDTLTTRQGVYLLEKVVDQCKEYSTADVHSWGAEEGLGAIYEKIKDLIKVRIFEAVALGGEKGLDRNLAAEILKTYYYKPYSNATEDSNNPILGRRELVVRFV